MYPAVKLSCSGSSMKEVHFYAKISLIRGADGRY